MPPELLRTRILDALQFIADREAQRRFQDRAPRVDVSTELLLQWEDGYRPHAPELGQAFEAEQLDALRAFHAVFVEVRDAVMFRAPPLERFVQTPQWQRYSEAARTTLGRLRTTPAAA